MIGFYPIAQEIKGNKGFCYRESVVENVDEREDKEYIQVEAPRKTQWITRRGPASDCTCK